MNRSRAVEVYFKNLNTPGRVLDRLVRWDETKTKQENAAALGISPENSERLATTFNLNFKKYISVDRALQTERNKLISFDFQDGKTLEAIAKKYKMTRQRVHQILKSLTEKRVKK